MHRTHMEELKEFTSDILYENYRTEKLTAMGIQQDPSVFKEVKYVISLMDKWLVVSHIISICIALCKRWRRSAQLTSKSCPRWKPRWEQYSKPRCKKRSKSWSTPKKRQVLQCKTCGDWIQLYLSLFISLHTIALCSSQANEGSSRKATSRVGGEETPSRVWPTHHPRESSQEARLHLQQVMIYRLLSHRCYRYGNNNYTKHISGYPYSSHTLNNALLLFVQ